MRLKAGIKKSGILTALEFSVLGTAGAYAAGATGAVDALVKDLYLCPNVATELTDVYVNAGPARAFRAPGSPPRRVGPRTDDGRPRRGDRHGPRRGEAQEYP